MAIWSGKFQEKHLTINAKASFFIGLCFIYSEIYDIFELSFEGINVWFTLTALILAIYWFVRGFESETSLSPSYTDEYISFIHQRSVKYAFYSVIVSAFLLMVFDEFLKSHLTIDNIGSSIIAIALISQGGFTMWWLHQESQEAQNEDDNYE